MNTPLSQLMLNLNPALNGFPLTDIYYDDDNTAYIVMALSGYKKEDIKVKYNKTTNILSVYVQEKPENPYENMECLDRKIAKRTFCKNFTFRSGYHIKDISFENGLLEIRVRQNEDDIQIIDIQ